MCVCVRVRKRERYREGERVRELTAPMRTAISSRDNSARCAREGTWFITNVALFALMPAGGRGSSRECGSERECVSVRECERVCLCV